MDPSRGRVTADKIEDTITALEAYHQQGATSLREHPKGVYDDGTIAAEAKLLGWNETKLRKARQFAHEQTGYNERRLKELFRLLRRHRPQFGIAYIGLLITVTWDDGRETLQKDCIEENWSKATLELEIKSLYADRRHGGRRRQVGDERGHLLAQLDDLADSWLRWCAVASEKCKIGKVKKRRLDILPPDVRDRVQAVTGAVKRLRKAIEAPLEEARSERRKQVVK